MTSLPNLIFRSSFVMNILFIFILEVDEPKFFPCFDKRYLILGKEMDDEEDMKSDSPKNSRDNDKPKDEEPKPNCENSNEPTLTVQEMIFQRYAFFSMTNTNQY